VSEQFLEGTSAQYKLCSAILSKLQKKNLSIYNRFKNDSNNTDEID